MLSLGLWTGSIFFFAIAVAPILFTVLPTRQLAGTVVSQSLARLHWVGFICGAIFLIAGILTTMLEGPWSAFRLRDLLLVLMLGITLYLQFGLERHMNHLKADMGVIDVVPKDDPRRVEFNRLHIWSTRLEGSVLIFGIVLMFLEAREESAERRYYRS